MAKEHSTGSVHDAIEYFYGKPWCDGFPVIPPSSCGNSRPAREIMKEPGPSRPDIPTRAVRLAARYARSKAVLGETRMVQSAVAGGSMCARS